MEAVLRKCTVERDRETTLESMDACKVSKLFRIPDELSSTSSDKAFTLDGIFLILSSWSR